MLKETDVEIGFIYSRKDPRQTKARNFVAKFIREKGLTAELKEVHQEVDSPILIVNGRALKDERRERRQSDDPMFPGVNEILQELERSIWSL